MRTYLSWSGRYMKPISTCTVEADTAIVPVPGMHIEAAEWSGNAELLEIRLPGPLDLESTLECGQAFRWNRVKGPDGRTWFRGVVDSIGVMVTTDDASRLLVLYEPNGTDRDSLARRIFSYFSLDDDLDAIHRFLLEEACPESRHRQHEVIKQAVRHARGLRILRQEPWECLVSYIISANKNIPAICKTVDYLAQSLGSPQGWASTPSQRPRPCWRPAPIASSNRNADTGPRISWMPPESPGQASRSPHRAALANGPSQA